MDVAKAFTFVTEDQRWLEKLGIGAIISFFSFLLFPIPLLAGYLVAITRNVMDGVEPPMPAWDDFGRLFKDGLFVMLAQLVYTLPFWLLACIAFFATVGLGSLSDINEDVAAAGFFATFGLVCCLGLIILVALLFISPAIVIQYVRTNDLAACFRFGEVLAIARNNLGDILIAFLASLGASITLSVVTSILSIIPCLGQIAAFIISLVVAPYFLAVNGHLYGQIAAKNSGKLIIE